MRYSKLMFGDSQSLSWKDGFIKQVSWSYNSLFNYSFYAVKCIKHFLTIEIPNSVQYYCSGLYYSWDSTSSFAVILSSITVLACLLAAFYHVYVLSKSFKVAEGSVKDANEKLTQEIAKQAKIEESISISSKVSEDLNMAVYMSERRRKSKEKRPERPIELEDRAPELLPGLRAERCLKDGMAVLNILEAEKKIPSEKKNSEENITMEHTSFKFGPQKGMSLNECLQNEHGTLEFVSDTPVVFMEVPSTKNINRPESKETERLISNCEATNKNQSSVSKTTKKKSDFEIHSSLKLPSPAEPAFVNSNGLNKLKPVPNENSNLRPKPRPVSRNSNITGTAKVKPLIRKSN